jgi:DNA-directed RNA polymerase specialized sigma subunit
MNYSKLTDNQLVNNIKKSLNPEENLKELVIRHSGIYLEMINGYSHGRSDYSKEEMIQEKEYEIYVSALNYDSNKGAKFSTYLGNQTKWKCLNKYNKKKREGLTPLEEQTLDFFSSKISPNPYDFTSRYEVFTKIIEYANNYHDLRVGEIFRLRYMEGKNNGVMPWKNISTKLGMSIQGCINIHNSIIKKIKHKFNKE